MKHLLIIFYLIKKKLTLLIAFLVNFLYLNNLNAETIALSCEHYKTTHYCIYDLGDTRKEKLCNKRTRTNNLLGKISMLIDLKKKVLTFNHIDNISFQDKGSVIDFSLSAPLEATPDEFYDIKTSLNRVNGELTMDWRADVSERDNQYMYYEIDDNGFGTVRTNFLKCKKIKELF